MLRHGIIALTGLLLLVMVACEPQPQTTGEMEEIPQQAALVLPDTTGAAVWDYLQQANYQEDWQLWPDKGEFYKGQDPHGALLTTYLNDEAYEALAGDATMMPAGAIIVKENYMPDSTLAAVTVMYKVGGFNAQHNDWFFSKHLSSGALDKAPNGMALEGRVPGCQACHGGQRNNDYLFTSPLAQAGSGQ